jgi:hypothetical protein
MVFPRGLGRRIWDLMFNGYRVSVLQDINLLERDWIKNVNILNFISHYT